MAIVQLFSPGGSSSINQKTFKSP